MKASLALACVIMLSACTETRVDKVDHGSVKGGDVNVDGSFWSGLFSFLSPYSVCQTTYGSCRISKASTGESCGCVFPPYGSAIGRVQ